jgi:predicted DNA binding CopG/RHH family protein
MTDTSQQAKATPKFASYEEEAHFWDTHDVTDYWEELEPVKMQFTKKPSKPVNVRFDDDALRDIRTLALQRGIGATTLIRMWALEKLREEKQSRARG